ncbi:hypothetical protein Glove_700g26 [Diversispora epigaea]|uniref:TLDc domain-containing protein n=1 Tax=Diversispora epigaea TaxID=1348612 RepID=A0A397G4K3_9GLOM|nr:hypothetical protein Glove_700g26 [Diversispora epigaea]
MSLSNISPIHLVNNNASCLRLKFAQIYLKNILISILKRDDLQLEEGKIWEYVIEWGKSKNQLPTNLDKWTSDNFLSLKETLKGCLSHIRYFSFSNEDVVERIYPYQKLLEHQLFSDINVKFIISSKKISLIVLPSRKILNATLPTRNTSIPLSSDIITNEHALKISSWIDRREIPYIENNPYEFQLLVRGSGNGFDVNTIFNICDKVSKTIIILKVKGTGEILGGYNPLKWDRNRNLYKLTKADVIAYSKPIRSSEFISSSWLISEKSLFSVEEYEVFKILPRK